MYYFKGGNSSFSASYKAGAGNIDLFLMDLLPFPQILTKPVLCKFYYCYLFSVRIQRISARVEKGRGSILVEILYLKAAFPNPKETYR